MKTLSVITMGCSKNRVDSEHILAAAEAAGWRIVDEEEVFSKGVDTLIVNTCGFILDAKEESIEMILNGVEAKKKGLVGELVVMGCLSQRYREELPAEIPEVDKWMGSYETDSILKYLGIRKPPKSLVRRHLTTPSHYAYLKISEGCDRHCSYCAIPSIRGRLASVPMEELLEEARGLAAKGVRELIVVAQDTTDYGRDLYGHRVLARLLSELEKIEGIEWIRIHYSYPTSFPKDVLEIMARSGKICPYMDIPLQHSSTKVLKAMRRGIDGPSTCALVETMRKAVPGIVLRTTMIVGHPGEGSREFRQLLDFVSKYKFERLGAFQYSQEEGTWGAKHLPDTVRPSTKQKRYEELMELQSSISLDFNRGRIGTDERVIVDSWDDERKCLVCRSRLESPGVDGEILISCPDRKKGPALVGKMLDVKITGADEYDLIAEMR